MSRLRIAVIGGGHLGTIHARLVRQLPELDLVAVVEKDPRTRQRLAEQLQVETSEDFSQIIPDIDAAIIAVPTTMHHRIARDLLAHDIHLLVEKPLAVDGAQAVELVQLAQARQVVLQVGHVERFNPAFLAFQRNLALDKPPVYIEAVREGALTFRSMDIGVVLDLMIHDLDLVLSLVKSPAQQVAATGFHWTGAHEDIAEARVTFANGCVAQFTASRISPSPRRAMRLFGDHWHAALDFAAQQAQVVRRGDRGDGAWEEVPFDQRARLQSEMFTELFPCTNLEVAGHNAILEELRDFVTSIRWGSSPRVSGADGLAALNVAEEIVAQIARRQVFAHPTARGVRDDAPHRKAG